MDTKDGSDYKKLPGSEVVPETPEIKIDEGKVVSLVALY
jgi:hypothetical protein